MRPAYRSVAMKKVRQNAHGLVVETDREPDAALSLERLLEDTDLVVEDGADVEGWWTAEKKRRATWKAWKQAVLTFAQKEWQRATDDSSSAEECSSVKVGAYTADVSALESMLLLQDEDEEEGEDNVESEEEEEDSEEDSEEESEEEEEEDDQDEIEDDAKELGLGKRKRD